MNKKATDMAQCYITMNGEAITGDGKVVFELAGRRLIAGHDMQWAHPEQDGIVRCVWYTNGVKLCESFQDWGTIKQSVRMMLSADSLLYPV